MSYDGTGSGLTIIRLGGSGFYNDPRMSARLSHPGLAYERTRDTSGNVSFEGDDFGLRKLEGALVRMESDFTCYGVG